MDNKCPQPDQSFPTEVISSVTINNEGYVVMTKDQGRSKALASTIVYQDGTEVFRKDWEYLSIMEDKEFNNKLFAFLHKCHSAGIEKFTAEILKKSKTKNDYFHDAKKLIKDGHPPEALALLKTGLECYPGDPFLMTYYGCLVAIVGNNPFEGIRICKESFRQLKKGMPVGKEHFYPTFYLNLGRAYLASGDKKRAVESFMTGLRFDNDEKHLNEEMQNLGIRRRPFLPFLRRSNLINKHIGKLLHALLKKKEQEEDEE